MSKTSLFFNSSLFLDADHFGLFSAEATWGSPPCPYCIRMFLGIKYLLLSPGPALWMAEFYMWLVVPQSGSWAHLFSLRRGLPPQVIARGYFRKSPGAQGALHCLSPAGGAMEGGCMSSEGWSSTRHPKFHRFLQCPLQGQCCWDGIKKLLLPEPLLVPLEQGSQAHFHWGPHQPCGGLQRAKIILGLYKCNYSLTVKELKLHPALWRQPQSWCGPWWKWVRHSCCRSFWGVLPS